MDFNGAELSVCFFLSLKINQWNQKALNFAWIVPFVPQFYPQYILYVQLHGNHVSLWWAPAFNFVYHTVPCASAFSVAAPLHWWLHNMWRISLCVLISRKGAYSWQEEIVVCVCVWPWKLNCRLNWVSDLLEVYSIWCEPATINKKISVKWHVKI